jgi:hypothetical protein
MADNVNIIVQDTINDIVVNAAVIVETIDINVQVAVDEVQIIANPNNYVVNINRIIGEQVQSDWDQADDQAPDYIKNKPTIPTLTSDLTNDGEDGVNPFITLLDIPPVTPAAMTKVDDTNVTLTLGGSPSTSLLQATSLTLGWTGTLADSRIASASTWNGKFTLPALTSGSVLFSNGTTIAQDNANLFWDDTNNRLGIGTNAPNRTFVVYDGSAPHIQLATSASGLTASSGFQLRIVSNNVLFTNFQASNMVFGNSGATHVTLFNSGNLLVSSTTTTDAGYKLDVNGTARVSGNVTLSNQLNLPGNNFSGTYKILVNSQPSSGDLVSGTRNCIQDQVKFFNPNSGSSTVYNSFVSSPTINQTNGSSGTTRGLYINPTLTAAADWRAIEVANGGAYINTTSVQASAILQADSTTKGFLPPRMTTTQKNAIATPAAGLVVYDTTLNKLCLYTTTWETITSI